MKWSIDDVPVFIAVVETGSLTQAARQLSISKSKVSKTLSRLEEAFGVRLLTRNSRNVRITGEGQTFYRHALQIVEQVQETDTVMSGLTAVPHGRLVAALPMAFARECVAPRLIEFKRRYPHVDLELILTSHAVDIIRDQVDVAVVVGALADSELVSRPLYQGSLVWITTPQYASEHLAHADTRDVLAHVTICEKRYGMKSFPVILPEGRTALNLSSGIIQANDPLVVREAVLNGAGVSMLPDQYCHAYLASGQLVRVFERVRFQESASILSVIYPGRRLLPSKTRAFLEFLDDVATTLQTQRDTLLAE